MCGSWYLPRLQLRGVLNTCHDFNNDFTLFYSNSSFINMYTDKDNNLLIDLRNNYGVNSVRLFRKWEIITKKIGRLQESQEVHAQMHKGQYNSS